LDIKLTNSKPSLYNIIKKDCPQCEAKFIFRVKVGGTGTVINDVLGDATYTFKAGLNKVECKICGAIFIAEAVVPSAPPTGPHR
jgi:hypothetical protein